MLSKALFPSSSNYRSGPPTTSPFTIQPNSEDSHDLKEIPIQDTWITMGGRLPHPSYCPDRLSYVVTFDGPNDPWNPQNWSTWKKYIINVPEHQHIACSQVWLAYTYPPPHASARSSRPSTAPCSPQAHLILHTNFTSAESSLRSAPACSS